MKKDNFFIPILVLCLIGTAMTGALALTHELTRERIADQAGEAQVGHRSEIFPEADEFVARDMGDQGISIDNVDSEYFEARDAAGSLLGHLLIGYGRGYAGPVPVMFGIDPEGQVVRARVMDHEETPGLGDVIEEPPFIDQFEHRSLDGRFVLRNPDSGDHLIDAATSATESSQAVVSAANAVSEAYHELELEVQ